MWSDLRNGQCLTPGKIPGTHFCLRLSLSLGRSVAGRIESMKNVKDLSMEGGSVYRPILNSYRKPTKGVSFNIPAGIFKAKEVKMSESFDVENVTLSRNVGSRLSIDVETYSWRTESSR
jgi:hypothetical protein